MGKERKKAIKTGIELFSWLCEIISEVLLPHHDSYIQMVQNYAERKNVCERVEQCYYKDFSTYPKNTCKRFSLMNLIL